MAPSDSPTVWGDIKQLIRLAAPIAAAQASQALMGVVDTAVVGRLGARQLAAVSLSNAMFFAVAVVGLGMMMGLDPLASQALGAGERTRARQLLWQGYWLALIASAVLGAGLGAGAAVMTSLPLEAETALLTRDCLLLRTAGLLPLLGYISVKAYLQARGKTLPLLWAALAANVFNLFADLLLVFGGSSLPGWTGPLRGVPALGARGSAIATALGTCLQLAIVVWAAAALDTEPLPEGSRKPIAADLRQAARVGLPIGLQMGAEVGVFALVGFLAGDLGDAQVAAHQVAITLASLSFSTAVGIGNAASVQVGWAIGQSDTRATRRAGLSAFATGAGVMSLSGLCFLLIPKTLATLLSPSPEVVAFSVPLLGVAAVFQISDGVQGVGAGVLRGAGDTRFAFVANVVGHYAIGLPLAILLGFKRHMGIVGMWWGLCAGLSAVAVALFSRFWSLSGKPIARLQPGSAPAMADG